MFSTLNGVGSKTVGAQSLSLSLSLSLLGKGSLSAGAASVPQVRWSTAVTEITITSRQNQKAHGKTKRLTDLQACDTGIMHMSWQLSWCFLPSVC